MGQNGAIQCTLNRKIWRRGGGGRLIGDFVSEFGASENVAAWRRSLHRCRRERLVVSSKMKAKVGFSST